MSGENDSGVLSALLTRGNGKQDMDTHRLHCELIVALAALKRESFPVLLWPWRPQRRKYGSYSAIVIAWSRKSKYDPDLQ